VSELRDSARWNERLSNFVSYALVSLMMLCLMQAMVQTGQRFLPGWDGTYLLVFGWLCALESLYASRLLRRAKASGQYRIAYRLSEWVVTLLALKVILYLVREPAQLWTDLPLWLKDFGENFFSGEYLIVMWAVVIIWLVAWRFADDLAELQNDEQLLDTLTGEVLRSDRGLVRQSLATNILLVGGAIAFLTALIRMDMSALGLSQPPLPRGLLNVIVYFVLGLALLSQTQFAILRARWAVERTPISRELAGRWTIYSIALLIVIVAAVSLLPTSQMLSLFATLEVVLRILFFLFSLLLFLFLLPFAWLFSLLRGAAGAPLPPPPPPQLPPAALSAAPPWLDILRSILVWLTLLGVVGFALYFYVTQNPQIARALRRSRWRWMMEGLTRLWGGLGGWSRRLASTVEAATARLFSRRGPLTAERFGYLSLRRLSPRGRVIFFYQALLRRAAQGGLPRQPAQTPSEYLPPLQSLVPDSADEAAALTETFLEARYSTHEVTGEQATLVKEHWERIKKSLRARLRKF
jgi:hypothetical protein